MVIANISPSAILHHLNSRKFYDFADYILVCGLPRKDHDTKALECIKDVCFKNGIELYMINDDAIFKAHDKYIQYDLEISYDELIKLDVGRKNYLVADCFREIIYEISIGNLYKLRERCCLLWKIINII